MYSRHLGSDCGARVDEFASSFNAIIGPVLSSCTIALSRAAATRGLPVLSASKATTLSNKTEFPTMYRLATSTVQYAEALAFALELGKVECVTIIYDQDEAVHRSVADRSAATSPLSLFIFKLDEVMLHSSSLPAIGRFPMYSIICRDFYDLFLNDVAERNIRVHSVYALPPPNERSLRQLISFWREVREKSSYSIAFIMYVWRLQSTHCRPSCSSAPPFVLGPLPSLPVHILPDSRLVSSHALGTAQRRMLSWRQPSI